MYLGLDIGTSAVKAILCDEGQTVVAQAEVPLEVSRPSPHYSEQNPEDWWRAVLSAFGQLRQQNAVGLASVKSIGLAGQMHGAVLLDQAGEVMRPAILWNDGRSAAECAELEASVPDFRKISGNIAMPGFTSPKLLWVKKNEPEIFAKTAKVLLPKDYVRFCLTGEYVAEMSDAAGTLWLDVANRDWSDDLLAAAGLDKSHMPRLVEGTDISGSLKTEIAGAYGFGKDVFVAGGAGDNAGGAVGIGAVKPGSAFLSLGTSGVLFISTDKFSPNPADAVHTFCHCLPDTWHQMSVILSAASCLSWVTKLTGARDEAALLEEIEAAGDQFDKLLFLPYLSGERTPHNDPDAMGVFFGLNHECDRAALGRVVLEGVSFAFVDGMDALLAAGAEFNHISVIGGGARSALWGQILASTLNCELSYHEGGEFGPAFGAARLARISVGDGTIEEICQAPKVVKVIKPEADKRDYYEKKISRYRQLYKTLRPEFTA